MLLLFAGLLYRFAKSRSKPERQHSLGIRIVQERYARGELTREEFQNMMRDLSVP